MYQHIKVFLLVALAFPCLSQSSISVAKFDYNGNEFTPKMNNYLQTKANSLNSYLANYLFGINNDFRQIKFKSCDVGVAMIKFKVKPKTGVTAVACTKSTSAMLARIFKEAVQHTSPYWTAGEDSSLYYILAIHYNLKEGCDDLQFYKDDLKTNMIFEFDDGARFENVNCVILPSYSFSTGAKEPFVSRLTDQDIINANDFVKNVILDKDFDMKKIPSYVYITHDTTGDTRGKFFQRITKENESIRKAINSNGNRYYIEHRKNVNREILSKFGLNYLDRDNDANTYYLICSEKIITAIIFKGGKLISYFTTVDEDSLRRKPWVL